MWHYNDGTVGKKIQNIKITKKLVDKARECMKTYDQERINFEAKIKQIKKDSKQLKKSFEAEWETSKNKTSKSNDTLEGLMKRLPKEAVRNMIELLQTLESKAA